MKTIFLDANILFAATLSETGGSRALFVLAKKRKIILKSSVYAIREAKRNIQKKLGENQLPIFLQLLSELKEVHDSLGKISLKPQKMEAKRAQEWEQLIQGKDLPILHAARDMKVDVLITLDRKDFMNEKMKKFSFPFRILTPGEFIESL